MKFQKKLFINFTLLFIMMIALAGVLMIKGYMRNSYQNARTQCIDSFSVLVTSVNSALESDGKKSMEERMTQACKTFVNSLTLRDDDVILLTAEESVVYSSLEEVPTMDAELFDYQNANSLNYEVAELDDEHVIMMSRQIILGDTTYELLFIYNIENIYSMYHRYLFILALFLAIISAISASAIFYFSMSITRPLKELVTKVQDVKKQNYDVELVQDTDIIEIQQLTQEFQEMSKEIRKQIEALELQNQMKQRFIDGLSHEIRTPLTSIVGYSSLMLQSKEMQPDKVHQAMETMHENGVRIQKLTENLVRLISLDQDSRTKEEVSVAEVLDSLQRTYQIRMQEEGVHFQCTQTELCVWSDRDLLTILLSNFLDNAIKAVKDTKHKDVVIEVRDREIRIQDSGKGIPQEDIGKIFEPFFMVDRSRKSSMGGFGLGLAISDRIMELLHIQFSIMSEVGIGTMIQLTFAEEDLR